MVVWTHVYPFKVVLDEFGTARRVHRSERWLQTVWACFLPGLKCHAPLKSGADASDVSRSSHGSREAWQPSSNVEGMIGGAGRGNGLAARQDAVV